MHVTAIIAAGGAGRRLGAATPKQLIDIGGGTMLQHSLKAFLAHPRITDVILVVPPGPGSLALAGVDAARVPAIDVVAGGERRQDSVANAFDQAGRIDQIGQQQGAHLRRGWDLRVRHG